MEQNTYIDEAIANPRKFWVETLESIRVSVTTPNFNAWFSPTFLIALSKREDGGVIAHVGCASAFVKNNLETRYHGFLQDFLTRALGVPCEIELEVKSDPEKTVKPTMQTSSPLFDTNQNSLHESVEQRAAVAGLRRGYTFVNYAVSSSNQMAWAAAEAVAKEPGTAYNPLFIWGGVGVGKTHLMNAVGYSILEADLSAGVLQCTGEQFTNDIVEGIRNKNTVTVRNKYRKLRALFVDDIQFIAGKDTVQEEFFHTFNALVGGGAQIILTSDRPPSEIARLEERLRSRFEAGLIVDISQPDFELRCAILQIKSVQKGLDLPMDIIQLIAGNVDSARKMEGFLTRLTTEIRIKGSILTPEVIQEMLGKPQSDTASVMGKVSSEAVITKVAEYYSVGKRALLGDSRQKTIALPRQVLMYILRMDLGLPLQEVGRVVGGRDHTTVMHAVDKITQLNSTNVTIRGDIQGIKKMFSQQSP
jgi:chromosomal replication initiator protein